MRASEVREKYLKFFEERGHVRIAPAPLVLEDDPTTLFNSSGMQQLVPYLSGQKHPQGTRLVNSQPSVRADNLNDDITEVGDNRHLTLFEMLGNWSLGDYFKTEQLSWLLELFVKELGLDKDRLWVTVFEGNSQVPKDVESIEIWRGLGISRENILEYDEKKNWWSTSGVPSQMPIGQIGGPDSEIFYEFPQIDHDPAFGNACHPNCDCGRFLEIGNSVFIQYKKVSEGKLVELPQKNVDFGGGLERLAAAANDDPDIFKTELFSKTITQLEKLSGKKYSDQNTKQLMRMIADHIKASVFIINSGVVPSNKLHGYILRKLIRRTVLKLKNLTEKITPSDLGPLVKSVYDEYKDTYLKDVSEKDSFTVIEDEMRKFFKTLDKGLKEVEKIEKIDGKLAFNLYQTHGFPLELTVELFKQKGQKVDIADFKKEFEKHKEGSRTAGKGMFKGGLADHSPEVVRLHTATHLLQAALREVLGKHVLQRGQNITAERSRFDFSHDKKLSPEELKKVEGIINVKIDEGLPVAHKIMKKEEAEKTGAIHQFGEKYGDEVNVYFVGADIDSAFSLEFCGGPHVANTAEIGRVKIIKQDKIGAGIIRVYLGLS